MIEDQTCKHDWLYQTLVYSDGHQLAGSSACERVYEDRYYCRHCLVVKDLNVRVHGNNWDKPIPGSVPK